MSLNLYMLQDIRHIYILYIYMHVNFALNISHCVVNSAIMMLVINVGITLPWHCKRIASCVASFKLLTLYALFMSYNLNRLRSG